MSVIVTDQLTRRYGERTGIERVDLRVAEGALFGFLGPNGAGKTTTIRVLLGFLRPTEGSAEVLGCDCWRDGARIRRDVGYLPGDLRLYSSLTGHDHLHTFGAVRGMDLSRPGADLADRFSLDLDVQARKMSRGMRQKLGLILALAHRPRLLVLDEPTASLDPLMQEQLIQHLRGLAAQGHTVFFSSHSLSEVERLCDHVAIVRDGRLVADEPLTSLRARARRHFTIRWAKDVRLDGIKAPESVEILDRDQHIWRGRLDGPVDEFVKWVNSHSLDDLALGQPDLESLFRGFYEEPEP